MVKIYTAQYNYKDADRLDITVKGQDPVGNSFAPTWEMVMSLKKNPDYGTLEYKADYHIHMLESFAKNKNVWLDILNKEEVTFVCFCKTGAFCHRQLLAEMFQSLGAEYMGER